jgi:hypothetical protein
VSNEMVEAALKIEMLVVAEELRKTYNVGPSGVVEER